MAIPDFRTVMRPLLECYADRTPRRIAEVEDELARHFMLTPEQRAEMLPSLRGGLRSG
jgi:restriction system protein